MKALVLCAGLGTRLRPLTKNKPKCLIDIGEYKIIDRIIAGLVANGIEDIVINVHWHYKQVLKHVGDNALFFYEPELLNTAGTINKLARYMGDSQGDFLVVNGDTLSNLKYKDLIAFHKRQNVSVTEARDKIGGKNVGAYVMHEEVARIMRPGMSIDECILEISENLGKTNGIQYPSEFVQGDIEWFDIGTFDGLKKARSFYEKKDKEMSSMQRA